MPALWISRVHVTDPETYQKYAKIATEAITSHGGKFLARGGKYQTMEGRDYARNVVVRFPSMADAVACYNSPLYAQALEFANVSSERNLVIIEEAE